MKKKENINKDEYMSEADRKNEEMMTTLKDLIANKNEYINNLYLDSMDDVLRKGLEIITGLVSALVTVLSMITIIISLGYGDMPTIITGLKIMGIVDIPASIFFV